MIVGGIASAGDPSAARSQRLASAVDEFEAQLLQFLVRGMQRAFLEESSGPSALYMDLAAGALSTSLAEGGGLNLTSGVAERLRHLDAKTAGLRAPGGDATDLEEPASVARPFFRLPPPTFAADVAGLMAARGAIAADGLTAAPVARTAPHSAPQSESRPTSAPPPVIEPAPATTIEHSPAVESAPPAITSSFGVRRDPFTGHERFHRGLDLRAARGDSVAAAAAGRVVRATESAGFGRHVVVQHEDGYETVYAHLDRIDVEPGAIVGAGSAIGDAGASGRATGPHLHFEVRRHGEPVDPLELLQEGRPGWVWPVGTFPEELDVLG